MSNEKYIVQRNQSIYCLFLSSVSIHLDLRTAIAIAMSGSILLAVVKILPCIRCCWWIDQSMLLRRKCILNQTSLELVQAANANDVCKHVWHLGTPNHHRHLEVRANGVKLQASKSQTALQMFGGLRCHINKLKVKVEERQQSWNRRKWKWK